MKKALGILLVCGAVASCEAGGVKTFYVSPKGDDDASGSWWRPFATFGRAQEAVRQAREAESFSRIEVLFKGGVYPLDAPILLQPAHGGTADCPVAYRARRGEQPVFTGGRAITGWREDPV